MSTQGGQNLQWQEFKLRFPVAAPGELFGKVSGFDLAASYRPKPPTRSFAFVLAVDFTEQLVASTRKQIVRGGMTSTDEKHFVVRNSMRKLIRHTSYESIREK